MFAANARHQVAYVPEVTFGVTPTTPSMILLRNTGVTVNLSKETFRSNEIRSDRQIVDFRHGVQRVQGDINIELSYGAFDTILESALFGAWSTNVLKVGVAPKSFTIERGFVDIAQYQAFSGCMANTLTLNINPNMITGSVGFVGKAMTPATSPLDASPDAAPTHAPFDGFSGTVLEGGSPIASITSLTLNLNNGLEPAFVLGSATTPQIFPGVADLTGTLTAYFEQPLYNKFVNETEAAVSVTLEGSSGGDITLLVPRIKYTGADVPVTQMTGGVILTMPFQALRDATAGTNLQITRVPA
jgi:hypothetical protein